MPRVPHALRTFLVAATALAALASAGTGPALAQAARFLAEIAKIDLAERQVTLKASMGQQSMRVVPGVALDAFKPGDKVLFTFGQDGSESVITNIEMAKP